MSALSPELMGLVDELAARASDAGAISLDAVGEAIGARFVRQDEIDAMLEELERRGHHVTSPEGGAGEAHLGLVIATARQLRVELGRPPRPQEIAERAGLPKAHVQHALALARVMQR